MNTLDQIKMKIKEALDLLNDFECEKTNQNEGWEHIWWDNFNDLNKWTDFLGPHRDAVNDTRSRFVKNNELVMLCRPEGEQVSASYLRSYNHKNPQNYAKTDVEDNFFIDSTNEDIKIEFQINLEKAFGSQGAWWAFWLMGPSTWNHETNEPWIPDSDIPYMCPYDGKADTGMEVDIFEYAPFYNQKRNNGFNCACYLGLNDPNLSIRPVHNSYGYFEDINNHLFKPIDLTKGWHTFTFIQTQDTYTFLVDNQEYWVVDDPKFITNGRVNALRMSWEVQDGLWGESGPTFKEIGKELEVRIKDVNVYSKPRAIS